MSGHSSTQLMRPQRIAVLKHRYIGDTLLTIPFLESLRHQYPEAHLTLLVSPGFLPLMSQCPWIDEVQGFEPHESGFWSAMGTLRAGQYDRIYLLKRSLSTALMSWLAGIPERIGFNTEGRGCLLTRSIPYRSHHVHEAQCYLDLLEDPNSQRPGAPLSCAVYPWLTTPVPPAVLAQLDHNRPRVVIHPTSTNPAKCWPVQHYVSLCRQLLAVADVQLVFLGTLDDYPLVHQLFAQLPSERLGQCLNLCGHTSLTESMALLAHMDLVVGNDSGMIHMAAAMDRPVIALFGPMDPKQWAPLSPKAMVLTHPNLPCRPCRLKITCQQTFPCLVEISPDTVLQLCLQHLQPPSPRTIH